MHNDSSGSDGALPSNPTPATPTPPPSGDGKKRFFGAFFALPELHQRIITGTIGAALLLTLIIGGGWMGICLIASIVSAAMIHEFTAMTFSLPDKQEKRYLLLCVVWFVGMSNLLFPKSEFELLIVCFLGLFTYYLFTATRHAHPEGAPEASDPFFVHFKELMYSLFGLLYLVFLPLYLTEIHAQAHGVHWTISFLLMIWANDTAAYFAGKKYGRHKLYPNISPKKTFEGSEAGLAAGVIVTIVYKLALFHGMSWVFAVVAPLLVGVFSQIGDLCESFLKRAYGIKDSGSILPGHGGFLDRFDGVVFSLPVMYACIRIFNG